MTLQKFWQQQSRCSAAILGSIVGDALGVPVEFTIRESLRADPVVGMREYGTHDQPAGTWSDDTSLTLCLAESLAERGMDLQDQAAKFVSWLNAASWTPRGTVFDIGRTTERAIMRLSDGVDPGEAGPAGEHHCGNGSLMRILPIGLFFAYAPRSERAKAAADASRLTHGHPRCQLACVMFCEIVAALVRGESIPGAVAAGREVLVELLLVAPFTPETDAFEQLVSPALSELDESEISSSGYVIHCLEASLWCTLRAESFRDGALAAVNLGDDTDTTGAVAGALLGLRFGLGAIPSEWIGALARLPDIERLSTEFQQACADRWRKDVATTEVP